MMTLRTPLRPIGRRLAETLIVAAAALGLQSPSRADTELPGVELPAPVSRALSEYAARGVKILDTFQAPGRWYGVVASTQGGGVILYIDESGENLFTGMMLDARGRANHTETALKRYFPEQYATLGSTIPEPALPPPVTGPGLTPSDLARIPSVRYAAFEGEPEATLYVFMDFGCSHCKGMFETLRSDAVSQALNERRIALAMIPVAFSGTETAYKSAFSLAMQPNPEKLATLFGHDAPLPFDITEKQIDAGSEQLVELMSVVRAHGMSAVPWVMLASDGNLVVREGAIEEAELIGLLPDPDATAQ
jgi:protein-disulfide isomerase